MNGNRILKIIPSASLAISLAFTSVASVPKDVVYAKENVRQDIRTEKGKMSAGHIIFSKKQLNKRIKVIKDYYYNKSKKLKIRKRKISLSPSNSICKMQYYFRGQDLLFGYGTEGKTEYKLYFYKNQLIQMIVDKPGNARKTYTQLYKKLESCFYDEDLVLYLNLENYAKKEMDNNNSKTKKIITKSTILITRVSGNTIMYHKLNCYGSDGCMWSIGAEVYTANLSKNVSIEDDSFSTEKTVKRKLKWIKNQVSNPNLGIVAQLSANGKKVSSIVIPYFA